MSADASGQENTQLPPIEGLSNQELRQEALNGINTTLGRLPFGPVVDGTGAAGYQRTQAGLDGLQCAYVRFTKAYDHGEQSGVQLELLGVFSGESSRIYSYIVSDHRLDRDQVTGEEREIALKKRSELQQKFSKDGLAPLEHRYYLISSDLDKPVQVSTESFVSRADRANPKDAEKVFVPELLEEARQTKKTDIDELSGQPLIKEANLQDLRDVAQIVRDYSKAVKEAINTTPHQLWGRNGLTQ